MPPRSVGSGSGAAGARPSPAACETSAMARSSPALIRRASAQDAFQAADVWLEARRFAYPAIPACIHTDAAVRLWVQEEVIPSSEVWVAERDARVVAVLALADGWIDQLYVSPAEQGVRIGFRLVQLAKERCPAACNSGLSRAILRPGGFTRGRGLQQFSAPTELETRSARPISGMSGAQTGQSPLPRPTQHHFESSDELSATQLESPQLHLRRWCPWHHQCPIPPGHSGRGPNRSATAHNRGRPAWPHSLVALH